ncbi:hypothetical protein Rxycam_02841 [Rubrobacter xylanophilus DSM 9941]|uniref:hypothetical protein n=1 Tax=Rubrobacter xylanophilus TaxID=49319 RepID=UPI001C641A15|nr:hypothetical protein [Rubrobacter xylanophilus]QYJ17004.1 hypothetical protein Rxycam_02841 [Rubrobacter xylanophilus DSM 9941]
MFKDLDWRSAARRSAVVVAIYLAVFYLLSVAFPESFRLRSSQDVTALLINAVFFFFIFTLIYALLDRRRARMMAEARKKREEGSERSVPGPLKGRPNPNTSRKKAARRRR